MYVYKSVCNCVILEGLNCKRYTNIWEGTERDREEGLQKFPQTTRLYITYTGNGELKSTCRRPRWRYSGAISEGRTHSCQPIELSSKFTKRK